MFAEPSPHAAALRQRLAAFMDEHVYPNETTYHEQVEAGDRAMEPVPGGHAVAGCDYHYPTAQSAVVKPNVSPFCGNRAGQSLARSDGLGKMSLNSRAE